MHNQGKRCHPNPPYLSLPTTDNHLQQRKELPTQAASPFTPSVGIPFRLPWAPFASLHTNPAWGGTKGFGCLCSSFQETFLTLGELKSRFIAHQEGIDNLGVYQLILAEFPGCLPWILSVQFCGTLYIYLLGHSLMQIQYLAVLMSSGMVVTYK